MLDGVEGEPPGVFGGVVPQFVGHKAVGQLMQGDTQQGGHGADEQGHKPPPVHVPEKLTE